ncbi:hypothetical protein C9374_004116 [Naegleria lovaniensis]|uniref:DUF4116 domain-containing protein n=1 Tax=Naegleria lovaniensis TaxID=51637 RepID=A0AA88GSS2_NAELO|nr:uncharacterized protein C9374_004116 [Naegleria lovaniensis]KAG2383445.1 hypothetical protein C9374_004116 [Naegleria lovaniensis]
MLSKTNYEFYSWDEGEAYGIIHKMPWTLNDYVKQQQHDLYLLGDGRSNVSTIVDDRCFSDFSFFEGLARINEASFKRLIAMAPISFRKDERVIPFLSSNASAFKYLHESLRHDKKLLMQMLAVNGNILNIYHLKSIKRSCFAIGEMFPKAFRWISGSVKKDHREVTRAAIETFFDALRFALDETDEEFMELARQSLSQTIRKGKEALCEIHQFIPNNIGS